MIYFKLGIEVEGIFRRSPASSALAKVKQMYETKQTKIDIDTYGGVHIACVLLKMYFRELPTPIFPRDTYPLLRKLADSKTDTDKITFIKTRILPTFSTPVFMLVKAVFRLLNKVHMNSGVNKMTSINLGIVWTPNLVKSDDAVADFAMCAMSGGAAGTVVRLCIERFDEMFT